MQIFVKTLNEKSISICVHFNDKISKIKEIIGQKNPEIKNGNLLFSGKYLSDENTISDYNIQNYSTIFMVGSLLGGSDGNGSSLYDGKFIQHNKINYLYKDIYKSFDDLKEGKPIKCDYKIFNLMNYFMISFKDFKRYYFSKKSMKVKLFKKENNQEGGEFNLIATIENVFCQEEIIQLAKLYFNSSDAYALISGKKYYLNIPSNINIYFGEDEINIYFENNISYSYDKKSSSKIYEPTINDPLKITENFYELFKYNKPNDKDGANFEYIPSEERKKFEWYINSLINTESVKIFKFTGPSGSGKSTTLLFYSRLNLNILYFNLKYYYELDKKNNQNAIYKYIMKECERINNIDKETFSSFLDKLRGQYYEI